MRITQSFIKSYRNYRKGNECGLLIQHQWVEGKLLPASEAMKVGTYFEFCLTGALPKDDKIPVPKTIKDGSPSAAYRKAKADADYVKGLLKEMGLEIVKSGVKLTKGNYEGTIDIIAKATRDITFNKGKIDEFILREGEMIVIDTKYSGLLDDRWSEMGWMFTDTQKEHHKVQAIQYHYISEVPFFYLVTDSAHKEKDDETKEPILPKVKFIHTPVDQFMVEQHILEGNDLFEDFEFNKEIGFKATPSLNKCMNCELKETCTEKVLIPELITVNLNVD